MLSPKHIFIALGLALLISVFRVYYLIVHTFNSSPVQMNFDSVTMSHLKVFFLFASPLNSFLFFTDLGSIFTSIHRSELKKQASLLPGSWNWRYNCYFQVSKQQVYFQSETTSKMINLHTLAVDSIELRCSPFTDSLKDPDSIFTLLEQKKEPFQFVIIALKTEYRLRITLINVKVSRRFWINPLAGHQNFITNTSTKMKFT